MEAVRRFFYLPLWLELPFRALASCLYRARARGAENIPVRGGVIMVANHLSYADPVVLQMACPRRLRFLGFQSEKSPAVFNWIFRSAGVIPINYEAPVAGLRRAVEALGRGDVVVVFPEGGISRTGQLMPLRRGYEFLARQSGAPVVPVAIDGLWGSLLSFSERKYLWKRPRLLRTPIRVHFGEPLPVSWADPVTLRGRLLELAAAAFAERPILNRNMGREAVVALAKRPGRIVAVDHTAERRVIKAAQLLAAASVLARWIRRHVPERRVGIVLPPGAGAIIANLAAVCAGKIPVNLNFTAARGTVESSLRAGEIRSVISAQAMREKVPQFPWPERTHDLRAVLTEAGGKRAMIPWLLAAWFLPAPLFARILGLHQNGGDEEAALLFTSGSAAEPKGVVLTHRNLLANCEQITSLPILPRTAVLLGCLPVFHSFGYTVTLWYPLVAGCRLATVPSPLDSRRMAETIQAEKVTVLVGAPTFLRPMLKKAAVGEMRSLTLVVAGAEALPEDLHRQFRDVFGLDIQQGYGMTEASPVVAVNQPDPPVPDTGTADPQAGGRTGSVGRLLPGIAARIQNPDTGEVLPLTATGMLLLKGANIFSGYLGRPTLVADNGGWYATGDLASFDRDGFLTIAGRLARFSKIGGEMVPHGAVERALVTALALDETEAPVVAVTSLPDPHKGEALILLSAVDLTVEHAREKLHAAGLPALWIPKRIVRVEKIPVLGTGKLDIGGCRKIAEASERIAHAIRHV